jgi:integration host factor subunit alpha
MTKADLVEMKDIVEAVFKILKDSLKNGEKIKISGFGNFSVRVKRPRRGRNPQTGDDIEISARRVLTFKASQILKDYINSMDREEVL